MSTTKPLDRTRSQRLPAPTLFVGPPSRNASALSLEKGARPALSRSHSLLSRQQTREQPTAVGAGPGSGPGGQQTNLPTQPSHLHLHHPANKDSLLNLSRQPTRTAPGASTNQLPAPETSNARTEALWAEMQNTLEEVELSAANGRDVFGPGHNAALEALRTAQIALAQAWAKSEADDDGGAHGSAFGGGHRREGSGGSSFEGGREGEDGEVGADSKRPFGHTDTIAADRDEKIEGHRRQGSQSGKSLLEEETENDIRLARRRREANDRYFQRVNRGVEEVVKRLEDVAKAMKGVEVESREIWGEGEGSGDGSADGGSNI